MIRKRAINKQGLSFFPFLTMKLVYYILHQIFITLHILVICGILLTIQRKEDYHCFFSCSAVALRQTQQVFSFLQQRHQSQRFIFITRVTSTAWKKSQLNFIFFIFKFEQFCNNKIICDIPERSKDSFSF